MTVGEVIDAFDVANWVEVRIGSGGPVRWADALSADDEVRALPVRKLSVYTATRRIEVCCLCAQFPDAEPHMETVAKPTLMIIAEETENRDA